MSVRLRGGEAIAGIEKACQEREWCMMADRLRTLAETLPGRLELLARAVLDLLDDEEFDLAAQVWAHLQDAVGIHDARRRAGPPLAFAPEGRPI